MKVQLNDLSRDANFDICVIGSGPAGVTVATKLSRAGNKVALLEGGGESYDPLSQDLYKGDIVGDRYYPLDIARLRFFGGTSNHWSGWCRPLDKEDFEAKGAFTKTTWPISKTDLDEYLNAARHILNIEEPPKDFVFEDSGLKRCYFNWSRPPVIFRNKYRDELINSKNITLILNANVTSFQTDANSVTSVEIDNGDNKRFRLKAKIFVLATGGIENSRILLWSNIKTNGQLIKNPKTLGKYWMEHPTFFIGHAILDSDLSTKPGDDGRIFFSPTKDTMLSERILNCSLRFEYVSYEGAKKIIADLACVAPELAIRASNKVGADLICGARIQASWEQEPVETNRIELSDELDRLGMPRPTLYWKKDATDLRTVRRTAETLGRYLARKDLGRVKLDDWVLGKADYPDQGEMAGFHHMGGTRMASNSDEGIVDSNCKVYGQDNLYIAGSSVFPSGGYANPTLTIVQLALRLGEHLLQRS